MPGRAPAAKPAASCSCTPRPPPAATSRSSRITARSTTTNARSSATATTGKSSAQTRSDGVHGPVLTDDDTRRLAAQHRYQACRDGVDILRAYDAQPGHQLEDAG